MRVSGEKVTPDGQEHFITLPPALTISGTVRDAATGDLIPSFRLIAGWPVTNPVTGVVGGRWSHIDRFWLRFEGGEFNHVYEEPALGSTPNPGYIFKFEAAGYAPFVTRPVALSEGAVQFDIALRAAASTTVTVTLPDGRPAANVDIGLVSPNTRLALAPGGFARRPSADNLLLTDSQGHFTLMPDDSIRNVIAAGTEGYAEATPAALAGEPVIVLQPWGRLEGTLLVQGQAGTNCALMFQLGMDRVSGISTDLTAYQVKTDNAGHFVFSQVPPGKHKLAQLITVRMEPSWTGTGLAEKTLTGVDIRPGETTTVTVNGQ